MSGASRENSTVSLSGEFVGSYATEVTASQSAHVKQAQRLAVEWADTGRCWMFPYMEKHL